MSLFINVINSTFAILSIPFIIVFFICRGIFKLLIKWQLPSLHDKIFPPEEKKKTPKKTYRQAPKYAGGRSLAGRSFYKNLPRTKVDSITMNTPQRSREIEKEKEQKEFDKLNWVNITNEFQTILDRVKNTNDNLFITGKAGTGKSTLLKYLYRFLRLNRSKNIVLLAPTGVAALNIGASTMHSFFVLDWGYLDPNNYKTNRTIQEDEMGFRIDLSVNKKVKALDLLIIDEVSMVRVDQLDTINTIMKRAMQNDLPFGGKRIIFFGDPFQLPPIVDSQNTAIRSFFEDRWGGSYFFKSHGYQQANIVNFELKKVFRQTDENFINVLNKIRIGDMNESDLDFINNRVDANFDESQENKSIILTPYKRIADQINTNNLNKINSQEYVFTAHLTDKMTLDNLPIREHLRLKIGAKVMFVKNNRPQWVNGTMGIIDSLFAAKNDEKTDGKVLVKIGGHNETFQVENAVWENYKYVYNNTTGKLERKVIGSASQIPLILGWAITIHKGQGLTLPAIEIKNDTGATFFEAGQAYVALSRTQKIEDIKLSHPIQITDILVNEEAKTFYNDANFEPFNSI